MKTAQICHATEISDFVFKAEFPLNFTNSVESGQWNPEIFLAAREVNLESFFAVWQRT
jgi:hypothetical protein